MTFKDYCALPIDERLSLLNKAKDVNGPSSSKAIYEMWEKWRIEELPPLSREEKLRAFNKSKEEWCGLYPVFKRISNIMDNFKTNDLLVEYVKQCPPSSIHDKAVEVYKKCISFKEKFTKKILTHLRFDPDTLDIWYQGVQYCIDKNKVKSFLNEYQSWYKKISVLWNDIYHLNQDFFYNSGYNRLGWEFYIEQSTLLESKAHEIEKLYEKILTLLKSGNELISKLDNEITLEYESNSLEMSLYERELEILRSHETDSGTDEEYCYVYTLECELCIFYVGISSNPGERFGQHILGAFSHEFHLLKSKFIQKYHNAIKQNIIYEGTRRECKIFEKQYIAEFDPLGNMTEGGEG